MTKTAVIQIRISPEEKTLWETKAKEHGKTTAEFIRAATNILCAVVPSDYKPHDSKFWPANAMSPTPPDLQAEAETYKPKKRNVITKAKTKPDVITPVITKLSKVERIQALGYDCARLSVNNDLVDSKGNKTGFAMLPAEVKEIILG